MDLEDGPDGGVANFLLVGGAGQLGKEAQRLVHLHLLEHGAAKSLGLNDVVEAADELPAHEGLGEASLIRGLISVPEAAVRVQIDEAAVFAADPAAGLARLGLVLG